MILTTEQMRFISSVQLFVDFDEAKQELIEFKRQPALLTMMKQGFSTETIASIVRAYIEIPFGVQLAMDKQDRAFNELGRLHQFGIIQSAVGLALDMIDEYLWMWEDGRD